METVIPPVDRGLIEKELTDELFVRDTNNGHNKIYIFNRYFMIPKMFKTFIIINSINIFH